MGDHAATPSTASQSAYPWRATVRTLFAAVIGFAAMWPLMVGTMGLPTDGWVASSIAATGAITRLMALPQFDAFIRSFLPWLTAEPAK